jgi:hypothetical protein
MERVLIPFEKHLPSTDIKRLLVTREMAEHPEKELESLIGDPDNRERASRFDAQAKKEIENIKFFLAGRAKDLFQMSNLELYERRFELIADIYLRTTSDINTALEEFVQMYQQIKREESELFGKLEIHLTFDDGAIDELIMEAIETTQDAGTLAFLLAKKLEYGLKLVRDRSGEDHFVITRGAVMNMEQYINGLVKTLYRQDFENDYSEPLKIGSDKD